MNTYFIIVDPGSARQLVVTDMSEDSFDKWQTKVSAQLRMHSAYTASVTVPDGTKRQTDVVVKGTALVMYMTKDDVESMQKRAQLIQVQGGLAKA